MLNLCKDKNFLFISYSAIGSKEKLNNNKLGLNMRGSWKIRENFVKYLKGFSSCLKVHKMILKLLTVHLLSQGNLPKLPDVTASNGYICFGHYLSNIHRNVMNRLLLARININFIHYKLKQLNYGVKH